MRLLTLFLVGVGVLLVGAGLLLLANAVVPKGEGLFESLIGLILGVSGRRTDLFR